MSHAHVADVANRPLLRLRDCYYFFGPLVLMVELNMISKSAIHAFLARTDSPSISLAAFNAAFTLYFAISSATEVTVLLCLSYLKNRADVLRLLGFAFVVLLLPICLALTVALTDVGNTVFGEWFGLSAQGQVEARATVGLLVFSVPILLLRGTAFALLMLNRKTIIITWSTFIRLASLAVSLFVLPNWLDGAAIGAGALVLCMASETVFAWCFAWRLLMALPAGGRQAQESFFGYWRFSWPWIVNTSAEMGVILTISVFLGRLSNAELAIAAFGVVHGLVSLLMGPMRNLTQTAQTLVARREDVRVMLVFTGQLVAFFTVMALVLFHTPLRDTILHDIMGLPAELAAYSEPALAVSFVMASFWSCTALFRGLLAKARTTNSLAVSGVLRILTAAAAGLISLAHPELNGALLGICAWILSYVVETTVSSWRLRKLGWYVEAST
jgi:progressive ankylosis protein